MSKVVTIKKCSDCPRLQARMLSTAYCSLAERNVNDREAIPLWCPLPDKEWGWREAYWNGATWVPLRQGNPPTECRELIVKHKGE